MHLLDFRQNIPRAQTGLESLCLFQQGFLGYYSQRAALGLAVIKMATQRKTSIMLLKLELNGGQ